MLTSIILYNIPNKISNSNNLSIYKNNLSKVNNNQFNKFENSKNGDNKGYDKSKQVVFHYIYKKILWYYKIWWSITSKRLVIYYSNNSKNYLKIKQNKADVNISIKNMNYKIYVAMITQIKHKCHIFIIVPQKTGKKIHSLVSKCRILKTRKIELTMIIIVVVIVIIKSIGILEKQHYW